MPAKYKIAISKIKLNQKLLPGDPMWHSFNASFKNLDIQSSDIAHAIYNGHAITTHHKDNWRATHNYLCGQHIGLDFDSEDKNSTLAHLSQDRFVSKYAALVHTTISHTDDTPRARVLFLLDQPIAQAKNYGLAASALLWLFGTADRQCKDAVRFFYGAPGCRINYLDNVLPLEIVKKIISNYTETGQNEKKQSIKKDYLPSATQQEAAEALQKIDPWKVDYDEWVTILMALHSQFGDGGYSLAESWAQGKRGEVAQKWRSFHQSGNGAGMVTIASLFGIAKRFGWSRTC